MRMTGILDSAPNAHCDNQAKQTNHEALFGISWFLLLGSDQTVAENRLILAANSGLGTTASYTYDGDGNRVSKTVNGVTTDYVVDTQNPTGYAQVLAEIQNGEVVKRYTYGHDLISMERKVDSNWVASYYGYDGTGSVRALTDSTGAVTDSYDYDAFGTLLYSGGSTPNEYLFHGERKDPETGLVYLRARYMDPAIGRFTTMDEYEGDNKNPQSFNKYAFTKNSPINWSDPSGFDATVKGNFRGIIDKFYSVFPKSSVEVITDPNRFDRQFLLQHPVYGFLETVHSFIVFKDARGFTELVLEGGPEKNESNAAWDYGHLKKVKSTKVAGSRVSPQVYLNLNDLYGFDLDSVKRLKSSILNAYDAYNNTATYFPVPDLRPGTVNSNSFAGSLLRRVGIYLEQPPGAIGWHNNMY